MALESCSDCAQPISQRARLCVHCGAPIFRPTGTDKGFHFVYWDLSYRRKFIRSIWITSITPLLLFLPDKQMPFGVSTTVWVAVAVLTGILQMIYTFIMWRTVEGG